MAIKTIGFIGIGNMGRPMATNLVKGGFQVVAYDADPARAAQFAKDADIPERLAALRTPDDFLRLLGEKGV